MKKNIFWASLCLIIIALVVIPLFTSYVPGTADGLAHKFRLVAFEKSLKEGNLRPLWLSDQAFGFGAPVFLFNYPLPYYLISLINMSGFDINRSVQIYEAATLILSFIFMYLLANKLWGRTAGVVAATVYTYAPYHLLTIYLYEGWGEFTAFVFPPLIVYLYQDQKYIFLIFSWFLFILSHNVSVLIFAPVLILLSIFMSGSSRGVLSAFILAVIISAFFWLPAISLNKYTAYPELITKEMGMRGSYFKSLTMQINTAISVIRRGNTNYYDFTVGLPVLLVGLIGLISFLRGPLAISARSLLFGIFILGLYLTNNASSWLWNLFTPLSLVVYPFRFLFLSTFAGALLAGVIAKKNIVLGGVLIILAVISGLPYTRPVVEIFPFPDNYFKQTQTVFAAPYTRKNTGTAEFLPKWADMDFLKKIEDDYLSGGNLPEKLVFSKGSGEISDLKIASEKISAKVKTGSPSSLTVNTFYFPNWEASRNREKLSIGKDREGRITLDLPKGEHDLELVFGISGIEKIANSISVVGIVLLLWKLLL